LLGADRAAAALRGFPDLRAQKTRPGQPPVNWLGAIGGITLVLIPVLAICAATIVTLRSPDAMKAFS